MAADGAGSDRSGQPTTLGPVADETAEGMPVPDVGAGDKDTAPQSQADAGDSLTVTLEPLASDEVADGQPLPGEVEGRQGPDRPMVQGADPEESQLPDSTADLSTYSDQSQTELAQRLDPETTGPSIDARQPAVREETAEEGGATCPEAGISVDAAVRTDCPSGGQQLAKIDPSGDRLAATERTAAPDADSGDQAERVPQETRLEGQETGMKPTVPGIKADKEGLDQARAPGQAAAEDLLAKESRPETPEVAVGASAEAEGGQPTTLARLTVPEPKAEEPGLGGEGVEGAAVAADGAGSDRSGQPTTLGPVADETAEGMPVPDVGAGDKDTAPQSQADAGDSLTVTLEPLASDEVADGQPLPGEVEGRQGPDRPMVRGADPEESQLPDSTADLSTYSDQSQTELAQRLDPETTGPSIDARQPAERDETAEGMPVPDVGAGDKDTAPQSQADAGDSLTVTLEPLASDEVADGQPLPGEVEGRQGPDRPMVRGADPEESQLPIPRRI